MMDIILPRFKLDSQAIKLQYNEGKGGCFPLHFDGDESIDGRRWSMIFYLNEDWQAEHGGELRLYPTWDSHIDIKPIEDRLVVFPTCRMPHRVMPSFHERYCFTIWMSESRPARPPPTSVPQVLKDLKAGKLSQKQALAQPDLWKAILKLRCRDEWQESLKQSHPPSSELDTALQNANEECERIAHALELGLPGFSKDADLREFCRQNAVQPDWYAWL